MRRSLTVAFGVLMLGAFACHDATAPRSTTRRDIPARQQRLGTGSFVTIDVSGALGTLGVSINSAGDIAGTFIDLHREHHGFVRTRDGSISTFDAAAAGGGVGQGTFVGSMNDAAEISGSFVDASNARHGFLRSRDGTITAFDPGPHQTFPAGINSGGTIAGRYIGATPFLPGGGGGVWFHGFVRSRDGTVTTFDVSPVGTFQTNPSSISSRGEVTGWFIGATRMSRGFVRAPDGTITTFDAAPDASQTFPSSINARGTIAGHYSDAALVQHGFIRTRDGTITTFDAPDAASATVAGGINDAGLVTGVYIDANHIEHGFVRTADGTITTLDVPGAQSTVPAGSSTSGAITGYYVANGVAHGFLFRPQG